jgi:uncharacterized membrane protein YqjE
MKPQDIVFIIGFLVVLYKRNSNLSVGIGILLLLLSVPLFSFWVFFTAERLVMYAAAFFLLAIIFNIISLNRGKNNKK